MTVHYSSLIQPSVQTPQTDAITNAAGPHLYGDFGWTPDGWILTLSRLTFAELIAVLEAARKVVE
jgi:hypothetical protein